MPSRTTLATTAALAALGSLVVHQLAYLLVFPLEATRAARLADHGHLDVQWALVLPPAVVAVTWFILQQVRALGLGRRLHPGTLTGATVGLFATQETVETVLRGEAAWRVLANPAVVLGLVLAPLVAWAFVRMLGAVSDLVLRLRSVPVAAAVARRPAILPSSDRVPTSSFLLGTPTRGPPVMV